MILKAYNTQSVDICGYLFYLPVLTAWNIPEKRKKIPEKGNKIPKKRNKKKPFRFPFIYFRRKL